uniref:Uncharacterized protein n=1 Tax=Rhizophora mucronata TaxID=61149 RepID=A0A2P2N626_RHIMU
MIGRIFTERIWQNKRGIQIHKICHLHGRMAHQVTQITYEV